MHLIIVGAGEMTRSVLERLGERWEVAVVDPDASRLGALGAGRELNRVVGDGSSIVALRRAGLAHADALVAASEDPEVGVEACRLAREAGISRILAIVRNGEHSTTFRELGISTISPTRLAARQVEARLEPRRVTSATFAAGRAEAIEFRIQPDSPLSGRSLQDLDLSQWVVASILRDDQLIVPKGASTLQANDLVTVVGAVEDFNAMVETFTGGRPHFPLDYGRNVLVALRQPFDVDQVVRAAAAMTRLTAAGTLVVVHDEPSTLDEAGAEQLRSVLEQVHGLEDNVETRAVAAPNTDLPTLIGLRERHSAGLLVMPRPRGRLEAVRVISTLRGVRLPALMVAGEGGYTRIVAPARDSIAGWRATWVAIDLAVQTGLPLEALGVVLPGFLSDQADEGRIRHAVDRMRDEASVQDVDVSSRIEIGNPVRVFRDLPADHLVVLGLGNRPISLLRPGGTAMIAAGANASVLVVPEPPRR